jgi:hypothetical protein
MADNDPQFSPAPYISILQRLLQKIEEIQSLLLKYEQDDNYKGIDALLRIYNDIFEDAELAKHIEYEIKLVAKSTYAYAPAQLTPQNAYYHLTLSIRSPELAWLNDLYSGKIEDLLQYFKFLFSGLDSVYIFRNKLKMERFKALSNEIASNITSFIEISLAEEKELPQVLKEQQAEQEQLRKIPLITYKANQEQLRIIIKSNNVQTLYHFTDIKNLESIRASRHLYSWKYCEENGIVIQAAGGNGLSRKLDVDKGLENYVRVSFCKIHPMRRRVLKEPSISELALLEIDPDVLYWAGTKYSDINAAANGAVIGETAKHLANIRFGVTQKPHTQWLEGKDFSYYQAEALIFEKIPLEYIKHF